MKDLIKTVAIILLLHLSGIQEMHGQPFKLGATAGPNFSTFHGSLNELRKFRIGWHAGGTASLNISGKWDLSLEIIYSQQGIRWEDGQAQYKIYNDYLDIPFLISYAFNDRLKALAGPGVGVLVKSREITKYPGYEDVQNTADQYNTIDIGLYIGASYSISRHISFGIRYYNGLMWVEVGANRRINAHFQIPLTVHF